MLITDITPTDKKKARVYIDYEYAFPLYLSEIRKFHLSVGEEIEEDIYDELVDIIIKRIRERILYLISDYDRSKNNIKQKMLTAGYREEHIEEALIKLEEYHYIDDVRYATGLAESLRDSKGASRRFIKNKLYEKGIDSNIIDSVLADMDFDESEQILCAIRKKGYDLDTLSELDQASQNKLFAYLSRKGFSSSDICRIIRK